MKLIRLSSLQCVLITALSCLMFFGAAQKALASIDPNPDVPSPTSIPMPRNVKDELRLAGDYLAGRGVEQDLSLAANWYEKAAGEGSPAAQLQIGYLYESGIGVPRDPERAFHWFQLADSSGSAIAKVSLGIAYLWGSGVAKNEQLAARFFTEAASRNIGLGATCLGEMYQMGIGVPQDHAIAEHWYVKGAKLRDPQAEFRLGAMFSEDADHVHDFRKAVKLLRDSADGGYVPAMHLLGYLLVVHSELAKSPGEALAVLNDSANAGSWRSSLVLGILARDGKDVPADAGEAYYRFRVAVLQGGEEARKFLNKDLMNLSHALGSEHTSQIDSQATQWYRHHQLVLEFVYKKGSNKINFPAYALAQPAEGMHAAQLIPPEPE